MHISWIFQKRSMASQVGAFALGAILVMLTLALRVYLNPEVTYPGVVFLVPAILLTSSIGGLRAGLFATLVATAFADFFLLPPLHSLRVRSAFELMDLIALAVTGVFIALICEMLREKIQSGERSNAELAKGYKAAGQLAAIVEGSSDAILGKSLDGIITSWNKSSEAIFGFGAAEAIGAHISMLTPPDLHSEEAKFLAEIAAGRTINSYETRRLHKDGSSIDVSLTISPVRDPNGTVIGASTIIRNITEQKLNEARLESMRADLVRVGRLNELGQVSAGLAHELNQPLAAMHNYSSVAKRLIANGEPASLVKASEAIDKASDQAIRAGEIIRRMRAFIEKRELCRAPEDINAIIDDAMAVGLLGAQAEGITTHLKLAPDVPAVFTDRVQIQQVLVNLVRNAVEAMADSPIRELTIATTVVENGDVDVAITDTGMGIPKEIADKLFTPFVTNKPGGMGIGLLICQSIVEAHGSRIAFETKVGGGTRFHFRLPTTKTAAAQTGAPERL